MENQIGETMEKVFFESLKKQFNAISARGVVVVIDQEKLHFFEAGLGAGKAVDVLNLIKKELLTKL